MMFLTQSTSKNKDLNLTSNTGVWGGGGGGGLPFIN